MSLRWAVFETLRAETERKAADAKQEVADELRHWKPFPRTPEEVLENQLKRERWAAAQVEVDAARRRQNAAAYEAATELLRENRKNRRRG